MNKTGPRESPSMPDSALDAARGIVRTLAGAGHEAWFAGGSVRDRLLGLDPNDYDIATSARPEEVEALFRRTLAIGKAFGVICVLTGGRQVEVATFRSDAAYGDGRHPDSVTFTDARTDVERRDFTVNGLLLDPETGEIRDHVGGEKDLERRLIRAIGDADARFEEDGLRLLRGVRFGAFMDFAIEDGTREAMRRQRHRLENVAPERIREELVKIATGSRMRRGDAWRTMVETELAEMVLPVKTGNEAAAEDGRIMDALASRELAPFLAVPLRRALPIGSTPAAWRRMGQSVADSLRCSGQEKTLLCRLLEFRQRYRGLLSATLARQRLAATLKDRSAHEDLFRAEGDAQETLDMLAATRAEYGDGLPAPHVPRWPMMRAATRMAGRNAARTRARMGDPADHARSA